jgi:hypothetical protein
MLINILGPILSPGINKRYPVVQTGTTLLTWDLRRYWNETIAYIAWIKPQSQLANMDWWLNHVYKFRLSRWPPCGTVKDGLWKNVKRTQYWWKSIVPWPVKLAVSKKDMTCIIVCQDMMIWTPGKLQSHKIEDLCLMLNCTSPCTNPLSQLH